MPLCTSPCQLQSFLVSQKQIGHLHLVLICQKHIPDGSASFPVIQGYKESSGWPWGPYIGIKLFWMVVSVCCPSLLVSCCLSKSISIDAEPSMYRYNIHVSEGPSRSTDPEAKRNWADSIQEARQVVWVFDHCVAVQASMGTIWQVMKSGLIWYIQSALIHIQSTRMCERSFHFKVHVQYMYKFHWWKDLVKHC